uniref:Uncharacterized protein n=1 Tax=Trichobilharzia regenti TaxID=157069 RepID=A0AA85IVV5_TRIRE|nr:unnamed protein product [Trichobilharzia regenti]
MDLNDRKLIILALVSTFVQVLVFYILFILSKTNELLKWLCNGEWIKLGLCLSGTFIMVIWIILRTFGRIKSAVEIFLAVIHCITMALAITAICSSFSDLCCWIALPVSFVLALVAIYIGVRLKVSIVGNIMPLLYVIAAASMAAILSSIYIVERIHPEVFSKVLSTSLIIFMLYMICYISQFIFGNGEKKMSSNDLIMTSSILALFINGLCFAVLLMCLKVTKKK